jgi:hypothetical protein
MRLLDRLRKVFENSPERDERGIVLQEELDVALAYQESHHLGLVKASTAHKRAVENYLTLLDSARAEERPSEAQFASEVERLGIVAAAESRGLRFAHASRLASEAYRMLEVPAAAAEEAGAEYDAAGTIMAEKAGALFRHMCREVAAGRAVVV